jgi:hypothetical protein
MQTGGGYETFARAFLQRLGGVALTLKREVEDVAGEVWKYLEGLSADLSEEQQIKAAEAAVSRLEMRQHWQQRRKRHRQHAARGASSTGTWRF